jgi:hypothetical protein
MRLIRTSLQFSSLGTTSWLGLASSQLKLAIILAQLIISLS